MPHRLEIRLFGSLVLHRGPQVLHAFPTRRAASLFAFLALHEGRMFDRAFLVGLFWPDRPDRHALASLRTALWRIRTSLLPLGPEVRASIKADRTKVGFSPEFAHWEDVAAFREGVVASRSAGDGPLDPAAADHLAEALSLYRGDLLEGCYDAWAIEEAEQLRTLRMEGLERLIRHHEAGDDWTGAAAWAREVLRLDPLREHVHRDLMRFLAEAGDRPAALRQFARCAALLWREMEIEPMEETAELRERIRRGGFPTSHGPGREGPAARRTWPRRVPGRTPEGHAGG